MTSNYYIVILLVVVCLGCFATGNASKSRMLDGAFGIVSVTLNMMI